MFFGCPSNVFSHRPSIGIFDDWWRERLRYTPFTYSYIRIVYTFVYVVYTLVLYRGVYKVYLQKRTRLKFLKIGILISNKFNVILSRNNILRVECTGPTASSTIGTHLSIIHLVAAYGVTQLLLDVLVEFDSSKKYASNSQKSQSARSGE